MKVHSNGLDPNNQAEEKTWPSTVPQMLPWELAQESGHCQDSSITVPFLQEGSQVVMQVEEPLWIASLFSRNTLLQWFQKCELLKATRGAAKSCPFLKTSILRRRGRERGKGSILSFLACLVLHEPGGDFYSLIYIHLFGVVVSNKGIITMVHHGKVGEEMRD